MANAERLLIEDEGEVYTVLVQTKIATDFSQIEVQEGRSRSL